MQPLVRKVDSSYYSVHNSKKEQKNRDAGKRSGLTFDLWTPMLTLRKASQHLDNPSDAPLAKVRGVKGGLSLALPGNFASTCFACNELTLMHIRKGVLFIGYCLLNHIVTFTKIPHL